MNLPFYLDLFLEDFLSFLCDTLAEPSVERLVCTLILDKEKERRLLHHLLVLFIIQRTKTLRVLDGITLEFLFALLVFLESEDIDILTTLARNHNR